LTPFISILLLTDAEYKSAPADIDTLRAKEVGWLICSIDIDAL